MTRYLRTPADLIAECDDQIADIENDPRPWPPKIRGEMDRDLSLLRNPRAAIVE